MPSSESERNRHTGDVASELLLTAEEANLFDRREVSQHEDDATRTSDKPLYFRYNTILYPTFSTVVFFVRASKKQEMRRAFGARNLEIGSGSTRTAYGNSHSMPWRALWSSTPLSLPLAFRPISVLRSFVLYTDSIPKSSPPRCTVPWPTVSIFQVCALCAMPMKLHEKNGGRFSS